MFGTRRRRHQQRIIEAITRLVDIRSKQHQASLLLDVEMERHNISTHDEIETMQQNAKKLFDEASSALNNYDTQFKTKTEELKDNQDALKQFHDHYNNLLKRGIDARKAFSNNLETAKENLEQITQISDMLASVRKYEREADELKKLYQNK